MPITCTHTHSVSRYAAAVAFLLVGGGVAAPAMAHGIAGNRFFPATIATDDPAVADELSLPTVSHADHATEVAGEYSKRITPNFGVSLATAWTHAKDNGATLDGFQNIELTAKYQFLTSASHEAILATGVSVEFGGSGAERVGAEDTTVVTPTLYFGKGFGDLPESAGWARPFAVTGLVGYSMPLSAHNNAGDLNPNSVVGGLALEYSLPYLTSQVHDYGLPTWVNRLTPLVEISFEAPVRHGDGAKTTATINPGILWSGRHMQIGAEAIFPANNESGHNVGWAIQAHFFIDDLFSKSIGRPIFGRRS